jgi:hypothetical protein
MRKHETDLWSVYDAVNTDVPGALDEAIKLRSRWVLDGLTINVMSRGEACETR